MNIKSQKVFFSGLMFMAAGAAFAWGATTYPIGTAARMGPGYFPLVLGVLLALLGAVITFKALVVETEDGEKMGIKQHCFCKFRELVLRCCAYAPDQGFMVR